MTPSSPDTDEIVKLAKECGLVDCIDDAILERNEWQGKLLAFYNAARKNGHQPPSPGATP